jgi:uncharacterized membrane-anchored protein
MQIKHVPTIDARYWTAIIVASMCGANSGDFLARYLDLGHVRGLLPLALVFFAILWAERRSRVPTELYYWLAIIVLRTGATNLADLATHDLKLDYLVFEAGLAVFLIAIVAWDRTNAPVLQQPAGVGGTIPATNGFYWVAMLTAGTLGTALGDYTADIVGLGVDFGSVVLMATFAGVLTISLLLGHMTKPWYWFSIVAARTAGTTMGDFLASKKGAGLGLPTSLACTAFLLTMIIIAWKSSPSPMAADGRA